MTEQEYHQHCLSQEEKDVTFLQSEIHQFMKDHGFEKARRIVDAGLAKAWCLIEYDRKIDEARK